ncbi:hypothetical protein GQ600_11809 [Phytophthora cactorum]|nr:hypothetical protein GQ600_11809 [Phytophthora cactorum]
MNQLCMKKREHLKKKTLRVCVRNQRAHEPDEVIARISHFFIYTLLLTALPREASYEKSMDLLGAIQNDVFKQRRGGSTQQLRVCGLIP